MLSAQVGKARVAEELVAVPEVDDAEIGGLAEEARGGEATVTADWIGSVASSRA